MKIFAHRGASGSFPENTLTAFREAALLRIEGVEFDVHLTKDRQLVVIHDETIDRTSNGTGYVKDMTLYELRKYDYGSWFSKDFAGEKIPTLGEVLAIFEGTEHRINIELKTDVFPYEGIENLVLKAIEVSQLEERIIISSFDHEIVQRVVKQAPHIEVAALFSNIVVDAVNYTKSIPVSVLHVSLPCVGRDSFRQAITAGMPVRVYTVNEIEEANILDSLGVEAIFTDESEKMLQYFHGLL